MLSALVHAAAKRILFDQREEWAELVRASRCSVSSRFLSVVIFAAYPFER